MYVNYVRRMEAALRPKCGRRRRRLVLTALLASAVQAATALAEAGYPPDVSLDEIQQRVAQCSAEHPRLLASKRELAALARSVEVDPLRKAVAALVVRAADGLLDAPPIQRELEGRRLLGQSRRCVHRTMTLAMAYHLTGDERYAARCREEMLAIAKFDDWNPTHFLDVAEMTFGMAIGYDWLYDQLDDDARKEIREAIVAKGVALPLATEHRRWVRAQNNWGQVCHGGLTAGALAVMEDEQELAARTVQNALQNVTASMAAYAPRGSYPEGPGYWSYGTSYNVLLIAMLDSAFGEDFGLSAAPGFAETGAYPALACGPSGLFFNYADGGAGRGPEPTRFWFAAKYKRPEWLQDELQSWQKLVDDGRASESLNRLLPVALLWMDDVPAGGQASTSLPLHWSSEGSVPVTIHRSSWSEAPATFVGLKAGSPRANHGQMDAGSFVLDSDGVRWAVDLGAEGYHAIEARGMSLWNSAQDSDRWKIFRQSNHGHNTLVIDGQLQVADGDAMVTAFSDDPADAYSIVDLTTVYRGQADSVRRGVRMLPNGEVVIQDELRGLAPGSKVRWGMITPGERVDDQRAGSGDGGVIELRQAGKQLTLTRLAPEAARWQTIDTAAPRNAWDSPNPGTRMAAFEVAAPAAGELTLVVVATPGSTASPVAAGRKTAPLADWVNK